MHTLSTEDSVTFDNTDSNRQLGWQHSQQSTCHGKKKN